MVPRFPLLLWHLLYCSFKEADVKTSRLLVSLYPSAVVCTDTDWICSWFVLVLVSPYLFFHRVLDKEFALCCFRFSALAFACTNPTNAFFIQNYHGLSPTTSPIQGLSSGNDDDDNDDDDRISQMRGSFPSKSRSRTHLNLGRSSRLFD